MRLTKEQERTAYNSGFNQRKAGSEMVTKKSGVAYYWHCAGWNDADIQIKGVKNVR